MARPMLLIQESLLTELWYKHSEGVPICKLIRMHNLPITHPTLSKLFSYMTAAENAPTKVAKIINASLFPEWLTDACAQLNVRVMTQPSSYRYEGKMPLGKWVENDWAKS